MLDLAASVEFSVLSTSTCMNAWLMHVKDTMTHVLPTSIKHYHMIHCIWSCFCWKGDVISHNNIKRRCNMWAFIQIQIRTEASSCNNVCVALRRGLLCQATSRSSRAEFFWMARNKKKEIKINKRWPPRPPQFFNRFLPATWIDSNSCLPCKLLFWGQQLQMASSKKKYQGETEN